MRTHLACHVALRHFGVWRTAVWVLALTSVATLAAWGVSWRDLWSTAAMVAAAMTALTVLGLAASLARVRPAALRLEEGRWTLTPGLTTGAGMIEVTQVDVAVDLGSFMLLSFRQVLASGRCGPRQWLPAQRRGHEHDWHALRCAVYSARPAPGRPGVRATAPPE